MESTRKPVPCHLIAGPLGVGKTTAIRRFVAGSPEYVAVIVNDFGETGYDASFIAEAGGAEKLRVENVPGGCLCCSSAAQLLPALEMFCKKPEIERILIEPSGIALLDPLLEMLYDAAPACGFELAPVIVVFNPAQSTAERIEKIPYWRHLAEHAGIAVLNRCDLAPPGTVEPLFQCLENWSPPKLKVIQTSHGDLPPDLFELRGPPVCAGEAHRRHADIPESGTFRSEEIFSLDALCEQLQVLAPELDRFKGIFRTEQGWFRLEIAAGLASCKPAAASAQTAAEWIGRGSSGAAACLEAAISKKII